MRIDELDEYQGLTAEMVREWLTRQNATFSEHHWRHPNGLYRYKDGEYGGLLWSSTLFQMSADFDKPNAQALLREINPRMRKGWPSDEAVRAHTQWLAQSGPTGHIICGLMAVDSDFGPCLKSRTARLDKTRAAEWLFWPCDANGNKVRWTEKGGVML